MKGGLSLKIELVGTIKPYIVMLGVLVTVKSVWAGSNVPRVAATAG
jgi:hypothetical protein